SPEIHAVNLDYVLESWQMFPRTRGSESVAIAGLLAPGFDRADRDLLFLRTYAPPGALPAQPLYIRAAPVQRGETVYLIGCPYSQPGCSQNVYRGQITERSGGTFTFSLNSPLELAGFSGAPVIDVKGHALGVLTAGYVSVEGGPASHGVAECLADLRNEIESRTPAAAPGGPLLAGASPTTQQVVMPGASTTPFGPQIPGSPQFAPSPFSPPAMDDHWKADLERQRQKMERSQREMERRQREMQSRMDEMHRDSQRRMEQRRQESQRRMDEMRQRMRGRR
ncbi:MAG TPA: trypsin-like peptidase domain-containing protein, partial [Pirellulales bacterium]|nr:trypsin-like peptidase domain-containing protein [Pirellulales bacterium]